MKVRIFLAAVASAISLTACVAPTQNISVNDPQAIANAISVTRDDFKKITNYKAPNVAVNKYDALFIRASKSDATGGIGYQIYLMDQYPGTWRFYDSAYDSNGNKLDVTQISRNLDGCSKYGCSYIEHIAINVTREYLEKNQENGIRFKVGGKGGEEIFFVPPTYITAFLTIAK